MRLLERELLFLSLYLIHLHHGSVRQRSPADDFLWCITICTREAPASSCVYLLYVFSARVRRFLVPASAVLPCLVSTARRRRCLIFDSYYDPYRGVVAYFRVVSGRVQQGEKIRFMNTARRWAGGRVGRKRGGMKSPRAPPPGPATRPAATAQGAVSRSPSRAPTPCLGLRANP